MTTDCYYEQRECAIFNRLMPFAASVMREGAWYSDVIHDARALAEAEPGDVFVWAVSSMGTYLCKPDDERDIFRNAQLHCTLTVRPFGRIELSSRKFPRDQ